jgi:hypothetical protein
MDCHTEGQVYNCVAVRLLPLKFALHYVICVVIIISLRWVIKYLYIFFLVYLQSLQAGCVRAPEIRQLLLPSSSFLIHYLLSSSH